ncbi:hypothetical protein NM208_g2337 [Fusarium decemcellulare]|uniref:Uncharacterized protein n=1 Tax=Fusarium decemcellulare TaxID=57161 RepID=A0ACC1ST25_9HYPO|nr:hypothetical protein NM208_g2337 [Fusarium decemcellulare]
MATNQYQITIINKSNLDKQYLLFQTNPTQNEQPSSNVFLNVYQASAIVPGADNNGGTSSTTFKITKEWYAVNGTSPSPLNANVTVTTTQSEPVTLGGASNQGTTLALTTVNSDGNDPEFDDSKTQSTAPNGSFVINTDSTFSFPNENNIFIGLGAPDPVESSLIVPVATIAALPSSSFTIWPHNKWFIGTGSFEPGTIIDIANVGVTQPVDFETGLPKQSFTNNPNGTYTPSA